MRLCGSELKNWITAWNFFTKTHHRAEAQLKRESSLQWGIPVIWKLSGWSQVSPPGRSCRAVTVQLPLWHVLCRGSKAIHQRSQNTEAVQTKSSVFFGCWARTHVRTRKQMVPVLWPVRRLFDCFCLLGFLCDIRCESDDSVRNQLWRYISCQKWVQVPYPTSYSKKELYHPTLGQISEAKCPAMNGMTQETNLLISLYFPRFTCWIHVTAFNTQFSPMTSFTLGKPPSVVGKCICHVCFLVNVFATRWEHQGAGTAVILLVFQLWANRFILQSLINERCHRQFASLSQQSFDNRTDGTNTTMQC